MTEHKTTVCECETCQAHRAGKQESTKLRCADGSVYRGKSEWAEKQEKKVEFLNDIGHTHTCQCVECGELTKSFNMHQEGMPCDFCSHHVNAEPSYCVTCDPENSNYDAYEFKVQTDPYTTDDHPHHPMYVPSDDPYFELNLVLRNARDQASQGKGKERHANNNPYEDQVICVVGRLLKDHPFGAHAFQVIKKTIEAGRLYKIAGPEAAYNEMLGAINYAAAMNILIKEKD